MLPKYNASRVRAVVAGRQSAYETVVARESSGLSLFRMGRDDVAKFCGAWWTVCLVDSRGNPSL